MEAKFTIGTMPVSEAKPILEKVKKSVGLNYKNATELPVAVVCANELLSMAGSKEKLLAHFDGYLSIHQRNCQAFV